MADVKTEDVFDSVAKEFGITATEASEAVKAVLDAVSGELFNKKKCRMIGLGELSLKKMKGRRIYNFVTKEADGMSKDFYKIIFKPTVELPE